MNTEIKSCANTVKCIGAISEFNLEFYPKEDNIIVRGQMVVESNGSYIRFNVFTTKKMKEQYYKLLEIVGIPHSFISSIDEDEYILFEEPIIVGMCGSVKIMNDKTIIKKVDFIQSNRPTKMFIISKLNEYGNQITYLSRSKNDDYIQASVQGIPYKIEDNFITFISTDKSINVNMIKCRYDKGLYDKIKSIPLGSICYLNLEWDNGYEINGNVVSGCVQSGFKLTDIKSTGFIQDVNTVKSLIKIYNIKNNKL